MALCVVENNFTTKKRTDTKLNKVNEQLVSVRTWLDDKHNWLIGRSYLAISKIMLKLALFCQKGPFASPDN
jgi:hypothetical protein